MALEAEMLKIDFQAKWPKKKKKNPQWMQLLKSENTLCSSSLTFTINWLFLGFYPSTEQKETFINITHGHSINCGGYFLIQRPTKSHEPENSNNGFKTKGISLPSTYATIFDDGFKNDDERDKPWRQHANDCFDLTDALQRWRAHLRHVLTS